MAGQQHSPLDIRDDDGRRKKRDIQTSFGEGFVMFCASLGLCKFISLIVISVVMMVVAVAVAVAAVIVVVVVVAVAVAVCHCRSGCGCVWRWLCL